MIIITIIVTITTIIRILMIIIIRMAMLIIIHMIIISIVRIPRDIIIKTIMTLTSAACVSDDSKMYVKHVCFLV